MHRQDGLLARTGRRSGTPRQSRRGQVRSKFCWVLKVFQVAAPEARKRMISTLAQSKREKRRGAVGQNHACGAPAAQDHEEGLNCRLPILGRLEEHDRACRGVHGLNVTR
jgi:hypothetical protein